MAEILCPKCGQPIPKAASTCPTCQAASAIASPEDAARAKVTSAGKDGAFSEGLPPLAPRPEPQPNTPRALNATLILAGVFALVALGLFLFTICFPPPNY